MGKDVILDVIDWDNKIDWDLIHKKALKGIEKDQT